MIAASMVRLSLCKVGTSTQQPLRGGEAKGLPEPTTASFPEQIQTGALHLQDHISFPGVKPNAQHARSTPPSLLNE